MLVGQSIGMHFMSSYRPPANGYRWNVLGESCGGHREDSNTRVLTPRYCMSNHVLALPTPPSAEPGQTGLPRQGEVGPHGICARQLVFAPLLGVFFYPSAFISCIPPSSLTMHAGQIAEFLRVPSSQQTHSSVWINDDIRPLPPHHQTWIRWAYITFWTINQICLSN